MNAELTMIMDAYHNGASLEETNEKLAAFGIHLNPDKNPDGGWTEAEMAEGFLPGEPSGPVQHLADFQTRIPELAGHTITVKVKEGTYQVSYKEDGYHRVSVKVG